MQGEAKPFRVLGILVRSQVYYIVSACEHADVSCLRDLASRDH
jgi:hypothetical protein